MEPKPINYSNKKPIKQDQGMPVVRTRSPTIEAICLADIHLCHSPPRARSVEPNWYEAQARVLKQVRDLREHLENRSLVGNFTRKHIPILCSGDVFDSGWQEHKCPPELINFALLHLPKMIAIPGQHDLPYHRYEDIKKSAFYTMVEVGLITLLGPNSPLELGHLRLHGFPWGFPPKPLIKPFDMMLEVALVHHFAWTKNTGYIGAPKKHRASRLMESLDGYDLAIFGDNHTPFEFGKICNMGSLFRRTIAQLDHKPSVGLLYSDGTIKRHYLDISEDKMSEKVEETTEEKEVPDLSEFMDGLRSLGDNTLDFEETMKRTMVDKGTSSEVEKEVLKAME